MLNFYVLNFAAGMAILLSSVVSVPSKVVQNETIKGVYYLGQVDGKAFFVDQPTTLRNWTEARDFCAQANLRLATITSSQQETFLQNALLRVPDIFAQSWIAGRTTQTLSQFVWDYDPNSTVSSNLEFYYSTSLQEHFACLNVIHVPLRLGAYPCSWDSGTLCETLP